MTKRIFVAIKKVRLPTEEEERTFPGLPLKILERKYKAATTDEERAFYALSALNMCANHPLPGWLYSATSDLWAAQLPPMPQSELALVVGYEQLRAECKAEGLSGYEADLKIAKEFGFLKPGKDDAEQQERAVHNLQRTRSRYRVKLRRKPGKRKRRPK